MQIKLIYVRDQIIKPEYHDRSFDSLIMRNIFTHIMESELKP